MLDMFKALLKQPYWVLALVFGVALVSLPCITIGDGFYWTTHQPSTLLPVWIGSVLIAVSAFGFFFGLHSSSSKEVADLGAGLDLTRVKETSQGFSTTVGGCEIRVVLGRLEEMAHKESVVVALPCNEYFDDRCAGDVRSALGAYVSRRFEGQVEDFVALMKTECRRKLGPGTELQKTDEERAESFGAGHCVLLMQPLGRSVPIALVSTTTQRAGRGLSARISYLFDGMREMVTRLADARLNEVVMPVLGAGHGGIDPPLAFVGLLLAVAESTRYRQEGHRLKRVTIVVFRRNPDSRPEVDQVVIRRALALIGTRS